MTKSLQEHWQVRKISSYFTFFSLFENRCKENIVHDYYSSEILCTTCVYIFNHTNSIYVYLGDGAGCFLCLHRRCYLWSNNTSRRAATKKAVSSWLVLHRVLRSRGLLLPGVSLQNAGNALWRAQFYFVYTKHTLAIQFVTLPFL